MAEATATVARPRPDGAADPDRAPAGDAVPFSAADGIAVVLLAALGLLVGLGFERVFAAGPLLRVSVGAVLGALLVGELVGRFGDRSWSTTLLTSTVAALVLAGPVVWSAAPSPSLLATVVRSLADAPTRILSLPLPVSTDPELLVVVFATVWAVVAVAAELARRAADPLLPLLPVAAGVAVPVLLGATGPEPSQGRWALTLVVAGALVLVRGALRGEGVIRSTRSAKELRRRRIVFGLPILLVAAVLAPSLAPAAPGIDGRARLDARNTPSVAPVRVDSPLAKVDALAADKQSTTAFTAQGPSGVTLWPLAVLDRYDGVAWSSTGELVRVDEQFPASASADTPGRQVTFDVEVDDTGTPFLPVPGPVVRLEGPEVVADLRNGNISLAEGRPRDVRYRVTSVISDATDAEREVAVRARTAATDPTRRLPEDPDIEALQGQAQLQVGVQEVDPSLSPDMRQLVGIERFLSDPLLFAITDKPVGGESVAGLVRLIIGDQKGASSKSPTKVRQGSARQFAAAFAVLARAAEFPTRVVVGYRTTGTGTTVERARNQITAWPEVKLEGIGWVAFDPIPDDRSDEPDQPEPEPEPPNSSGTTAVTPITLEPPRPPDSRPTASPPANRTPLLVGLGVTLVLLVLAIALLRRPIRRWRRRRGDPRQQVLGAWAEVVDLLRRAGVPADPSRTVAEVRRGAAPALAGPGRSALDDLGALVTRVTWSPAPTAEDAPTAAWAEVAAVRRHLVPRRRRAPGDRSPMPPAEALRTVAQRPLEGPGTRSEQ